MTTWCIASDDRRPAPGEPPEIEAAFFLEHRHFRRGSTAHQLAHVELQHRHFRRGWPRPGHVLATVDHRHIQRCPEGPIATSDEEIRSLTFEGPSCGGFSRPAAARTGYVVLRIEPGGHGRPSRPWRASSAFPTLTGPVALAARLRGPGGPFWPLLGAIEGRRCLVGLVDRLGTKRRLVTVEGRFLTLGGQRTPARC